MSSQGRDSPTIYSNQPPYLRPQYTPQPPPIGNYYKSTPSSSDTSSYTPLKSKPLPLQTSTRRRERKDSRRGGYEEYRSDEEYYGNGYGNGIYTPSTTTSSSRHTRPQAMTRRSSSLPSYGERQSQVDNRRYSNSSDYEPELGSQTSDRVRSSKRAPGGGHENLRDHFSRTPMGVGIGVVGALAGGWAVRKAHESDYVAKEKKGSGSAFLTFMGAALGGMAASAAVDRLEEKKDGLSPHQSGGGGSRGGGSRDGRSRDGRSRDGRSRDGRSKDGRRDSWDEDRDER